MPSYYLHNGVVDAISQGAGRVVAGIIVAWAVYVVGAAFLAASWVVEFRYVAVPFVIWLALRGHKNRKIEGAMLALWLVLAVLIFGKIVDTQLFL